MHLIGRLLHFPIVYIGQYTCIVQNYLEACLVALLRPFLATFPFASLGLGLLGV